MSRTDDSGKDEEAFLGKLRSNFLGLEFMAYGEGMNPKKCLGTTNVSKVSWDLPDIKKKEGS